MESAVFRKLWYLSSTLAALRMVQPRTLSFLNPVDMDYTRSNASFLLELTLW